jgi:hypothetical protein
MSIDMSVCEREVGNKRRTGDAGRGTGRRECVDRSEAQAEASGAITCGRKRWTDATWTRDASCDPSFF